jgi:hypothetical protein
MGKIVRRKRRRRRIRMKKRRSGQTVRKWMVRSLKKRKSLRNA